jgi:hypothetical protein
MKGVAPDGPFEGVPPHLQQGLAHWWESVAQAGSGGYFGHERELRELASHLREGVNPNWNAADLGRGMIATARQNDEFFLDLVDGTLQIFRVGNAATNALKRLLDISGSVWSVAPDGQSLVRVVSDEAQATYESATSVADDITTEMREAWVNAFGRNADPSDAWDHAIKAMEALFIPMIVPNQTKPNLGHAVGQLRNQGQLYKLVLPGKDLNHDVGPLVGMLDLIWPNVDRHPGVATTRPPTEEEARAVVALAATIVQWHRDGWVVQMR